MKATGIIILFVGLLVLLYSWNLDTTVEVPKTGYESIYNYNKTPDRVNNIGLMNERQNKIILSGIIMIIGVIVLVASSFHKTQERVAVSDASSVICPHCNGEIELSQDEINSKHFVCCDCSKEVELV